MAARRRQPRTWTALDIGAVLALCVYGLAAWNVRQAGRRVETAPVRPVAAVPSACLRVEGRFRTTASFPLELLLYRRVGGIHLLEHFAPVPIRRGRLRYLYPAQEPRADYTAVLLDRSGRWCRLPVPAPAQTLTLRPAPAPWFL